MAERDNSHGNGCGCGCASLITVMTVGLGLAIASTGASIGGSFRIPFTESNVTLAGCVGSTEKARHSLPDYIEERVGEDQDFINSSQTLTIGITEGCATFIVGEQEGAPEIDIFINFN